MIDKGSQSSQDITRKPFDEFAAASAVGLAMTSQAMQLWFGMVSGVARASQDILERQIAMRSGEVDAYSSQPHSVETEAKSATRTVVADFERAARVVDVTVNMLNSAERPAISRAKADALPAAKVIPFKAGSAKAMMKPAVQPKAAAESKSALADATPIRDEPTVSLANILPEDFRQPKPVAKPARKSDLKRIEGVGPRLETVLNGLGIWTFAQVASWHAEEIAWIDDYLGLQGRVVRDDWVSQAVALHKGRSR